MTARILLQLRPLSISSSQRLMTSKERPMTAIADATLATREKIDRLEAQMRRQPQVEIPVIHTFGPGFYARTIVLEPGTEAVGKVHATEHIFMLTEGELALVAEDGAVVVKAPFQAVSPPGVKRAVKAHTRCVVTNVHITHETDLAMLEAALIDAQALPAPAMKGIV